MSQVRVSVTLPKHVRDRLVDEARTRPESLDAHLRRLIMSASGIPEPSLLDELRQSRAEATARAREVGSARRKIRELQARLNALHASDSHGFDQPAWSLDEGSRSPAEREAWWRWLATGVDRLRERYGVVQPGYDGYGRETEWWWESPARVRAIAIAIAWEEALDRGGESVPYDPRYGEAFLEYLWRLASRDLALVEIGRYFRSAERERSEKTAFESHVTGIRMAAQVRP